MAGAYVDDLRRLLAPAVAALPAGVSLEIKPFFGGAAAYANRRICITLTPAGLALKLPEEARARLLAEGAQPLRYFPKAPLKKHYVVLPERLAGNPRSLQTRARQAIDHALTLPAPQRNKPKP